MSDREMDRVIKRALLDALARDMEAAGETVFLPSARHLRQMKAMLRDPLKWAGRKTRPLWRQALRQAAMFLLIVSIGFGCLLAAVPSARAAVRQWILEVYETYIVYRYSGEVTGETLPRYEITALPDGYAEVEREEFFANESVVYENDEGDVIYFDYGFVQQGGEYFLETEGKEIFDITIDGQKGTFFRSKTPGQFNSIVWMNTEENIQFAIDACFDENAILGMAGSISLVKTPK